ncbi:MAG: AbrB/MazE/SpoVT family DNA-binding domain-containing protein [Spirochaetales bacterium]|nr:AbrB/MazE/SpoVT family DNA-binding domain-containing protein [Spirochaetales bacterium]
MRTKVDRFGRIVVPKEIRDRHGLVPGSEVEIEETAEVILLRLLTDLPGLVEKDGLLVFRGRATGQLETSLRSHRNERLRRAQGA